MLTILTVIIIVASTFVALNGLLYQPKKDPNGPPNWKNISSTGKILFGIMLLLAALSITQTIYSSLTQKNEISELVEINNQLIKVMSVADGYNALVTGIVVFDRPMTEVQIRAALQNLFLKYVEIDLSAANKLGSYKGRIDYGAHPEVRKFLRVSEESDSELSNRYMQFLSPTSYFFEVRCSRLKILSPQKIQYARMSADEQIRAEVIPAPMYRDFRRLYNIRDIFIGDLVIEELDKLRLDKRVGDLY